MTTIINLFGGPGSGKSTYAAMIYSELKMHDINCELVTEYAKDKVWENSLDILSDQIYIFGKQVHKIRRLIGKVDYIITDSPILLSLYYGKKESNNFKKLVFEEHNKYKNINIFIKRNKPYEKIGRLQNEEKAREIDTEIWSMLLLNKINHTSIKGTKDNILSIINRIIDGDINGV